MPRITAATRGAFWHRSIQIYEGSLPEQRSRVSAMKRVSRNKMKMFAQTRNHFPRVNPHLPSMKTHHHVYPWDPPTQALRMLALSPLDLL